MKKVNTHASVEELITAVKGRTVTEEDYEAFVERCRKREAEFKRTEQRMKPDASFYNFQYGVKNPTVISDETLKLAEMVANQPPLPDDHESIEKWATRLAADIAKGRD